jgi:ribosomal protein S1
MSMIWRASLTSRRLSSSSRTTFALNDQEGLPNVVTGKRLDADGTQEEHTWRLLSRAMEEKQEVFARVLERTKTGYLVEIFGRVAFLPASLSGDRTATLKRDMPLPRNE